MPAGDVDDRGGDAAGGRAVLEVDGDVLAELVRASAAVCAGGWPDRFALETAIGPVFSSSSIATGCSGIRSATVPRASPRSQVSDGACRTTRVSPPGQNASTRSRVRESTLLTRPSIVDHDPTSTGTGMFRPRPLTRSRSATATASNASAPSP